MRGRRKKRSAEARHVACSKIFAMKPPVVVMYERLQPIARPVCLVCAMSLAALLFATYLSFVLRGFPMDW